MASLVRILSFYWITYHRGVGGECGGLPYHVFQSPHGVGASCLCAALDRRVNDRPSDMLEMDTASVALRRVDGMAGQR